MAFEKDAHQPNALQPGSEVKPPLTAFQRDALQGQAFQIGYTAITGGGTIASGAAYAEGATTVALVGAATAGAAIVSTGELQALLAGAALAAGAISSEGATSVILTGAVTASGAVTSAGATEAVLVGGTAPSIAAGAASSGGSTTAAFTGLAITEERDTDAWQRHADRRRHKKRVEEEELMAIVRAMAPALFSRMRGRRALRPTQ